MKSISTAASAKDVAFLGWASRAFVDARSDEIDHEQTKSTAYETTTTTKTINDMGTNDGTNYADGIETSSEAVLFDGAITGLGEKDGGVCRHGGDSRPGGHDLEPDTKPCPAA